MADSLHTSIMANTWFTTLPKAKRKRHVGGDLVQIGYSKYMHWYYFGHHSIDGNNNNCHGWLSFEEPFTPHCWVFCQFGFIVALAQVNSMLAFNYIKQIPHNESPFEKGMFTQSIAKGLIMNEENDGNYDGDFNKILICNHTLP